MPFVTELLNNDDQFLPMVHTEFLAFETPDNKLRELYFPKADTTVEARNAAMTEAAERQAQWHHKDPTSRWLLVRDVDSQQIAGASLWHIYDRNPHAESTDDECYWFAAGEDRQTANALMEQLLTPRMRYMAKPHVLLDIFFTHPDFRRMGVGRLMMDWGVKEADRLGYESYVDATDMGKHLYKTYGFVEGPKKELSMEGWDDTERKRELRAKLLPFGWTVMTRPVNGVFEHGTTKLPWD